jgi:hypothetical protein
MGVRSVGPDDAPHVEALPHVRLFAISTYDGQGNGRTLSFRTGAGPRQTVKSGHQGCQTRAVFLSQRGES